jgi:membrane protease YdiL (CAAX protease family)
VKLLFGPTGHLRNGWWMLIFVAFVAATRFLYRPVTRGLSGLGVEASWLEVVPVLLVLLATWACTRLRREPLSSVGFQLGRPWLRQMAAGTLLGVGTLALAAGLIWAVGGLRFELDPARSLSTLTQGLYLFLCVALFEEVLFRGFLFQRLVAGLGAWPAQLLIAALFAIGHWGNPGMEGATMVWATVELALAAVLMGLAWLRTRSLALPIGIHLGWNWAQGHVLGFGVSGYDHPGWLRPLFQDRPEWITGGAFGPEASIFGVAADLVLLVALWRWKGSLPALPAAAPAEAIAVVAPGEPVPAA